jgi:hypothetical protein
LVTCHNHSRDKTRIANCNCINMLRNVLQVSANRNFGFSLTVSSGILSRKQSHFGGKRKTTQLKQMINSPNLEFIMEAHSGLSARIVEETGIYTVLIF